MLMEWSDLELGDIIQINPEIVEKYKGRHHWLGNWGSITLKVVEAYLLQNGNFSCTIIVRKSNADDVGYFYLNKDGKHSCQNKSDTIPFFDIVSLKED